MLCVLTGSNPFLPPSIIPAGVGYGPPTLGGKKAHCDHLLIQSRAEIHREKPENIIAITHLLRPIHGSNLHRENLKICRQSV